MKEIEKDKEGVRQNMNTESTEHVISPAEGYCIYIAYYATADNRLYKNGELQESYVGAAYTIMGLPGFKPYKTENAAKKNIPTWEKRYEKRYEKGWRTHVGGVVQVTNKLIDKATKDIQKEVKKAMMHFGDI